jgi:hypothetical protein
MKEFLYGAIELVDLTAVLDRIICKLYYAGDLSINIRRTLVKYK